MPVEMYFEDESIKVKDYKLGENVSVIQTTKNEFY